MIARSWTPAPGLIQGGMIRTLGQRRWWHGCRFGAVAAMRGRSPGRSWLLTRPIVGERVVGDVGHRAGWRVAAAGVDEVVDDTEVAGHHEQGSRDTGLGTLDVATLVIDGQRDRLIFPSAGIHTAAVIPGPDLLLVHHMGHDLPVPLNGFLASAIAAHITRA